MANEQELEQIAYELSMQRARGEAIRQQMQAMQSGVLEIASAIDAINNLKKAKSDTLVPVGAGAYISCPKPDTTKVVLNIGAGVMLKKAPDEAVAALQARQKKVSESIDAAQQDLAQIISAMDRLTQRASAISAEEARNVRPAKE